jgi:hypothetical protein
VTTGIRSGIVRFEVIIGQKIYFTVPLKKMEDMEFLKAMLAEMNANMKTS